MFKLLILMYYTLNFFSNDIRTSSSWEKFWGATIAWAHHAVIVRAKKQAIIGLLFTILLATIFTLLQGMEYVEAPFNINDSVFGSCFYIATGFHLFIGTCCLIVSPLRIVYNHFMSTHHFGFESAAWYWHFVDVVWLFLFITVYWWGGIH
mgnify:FL=1